MKIQDLKWSLWEIRNSKSWSQRYLFYSTSECCPLKVFEILMVDKIIASKLQSATLDLLSKLGFVMQSDKSFLKPTQTIKFLGFAIDLVRHDYFNTKWEIF